MEIGKIIEALTICGSDIGCAKCPYDGHGCTEVMMKDAVQQLEAAREIISRGTQKEYVLKSNGLQGRPYRSVLMFDKDGRFLRKFDSAVEAGEHVDRSPDTIRMCCRGKLFSCGGYRWAYEDAVC
jgi:hypothetical protein